MRKNKNLLLIFVRNPEYGKVKNRLAADVGAQTALDIYKFLLQHTAAITRDLDMDKEVHYSEKIDVNDFWDDAVYRKKLQKGEDLGERMQNAFQEGFAAGYSNIIIIGSDLYDLNTKDLERAFVVLETSEYVIGPAEDGGYYLLGMKSVNYAIFRNKRWSTETVFQDTIKDMNTKKITILDRRNDIDLAEDLQDHPAFQQFFKNT